MRVLPIICKYILSDLIFWPPKSGALITSCSNESHKLNHVLCEELPFACPERTALTSFTGWPWAIGL